MDGDSSPAPRARQARSLARRDDIVTAAYALFAEQGYSATRLEDVATRAGVAKGLVAFHFKTKEGLFRAVLAESIPPLLAEVETLTPGPGETAADALEAALRMIYRKLLEQPEARTILKLLTAEGDKFPELTAIYHADVARRSSASIQRILELGVQRGEFVVADTAMAPRVVLGPVIMAMFWRLLFEQQEPVEAARLFDIHLSMVLDGLRPR